MSQASKKQKIKHIQFWGWLKPKALTGTHGGAKIELPKAAIEVDLPCIQVHPIA